MYLQWVPWPHFQCYFVCLEMYSENKVGDILIANVDLLDVEQHFISPFCAKGIGKN